MLHIVVWFMMVVTVRVGSATSYFSRLIIRDIISLFQMAYHAPQPWLRCNTSRVLQVSKVKSPQTDAALFSAQGAAELDESMAAWSL